VYGAEYRLQCVGNDGGNVGSLHQVGPTNALAKERKEHRMHVCQDLLNQYEAEGDSFLDRIITGDETWCHHYEPESKRQSME